MCSSSRNCRGLILLGLVLLCGCTGSRWARSHPDYAEKYPHHTDNLARMTKQAVDARHVAGDTGFYVGAAGRDEPLAMGLSAGVFHYPEYYRGMVEVRGGVNGLIAEGDHPVSGGLEGGLRVQSPSRLAPFAGVGAYVGWLPDWLNVEDGVDNNGNGYIDEPFEDNAYAVLAAYPELGVHFWATSRVRLTASASYYVTTINDNSNFVLYGLSLSYLPHDNGEVYVPPVACSDPVDLPTYDPAAYPSEPWPLKTGPRGDPIPVTGRDAPYSKLPVP